jgi:hypothetical protein
MRRKDNLLNMVRLFCAENIQAGAFTLRGGIQRLVQSRRRLFNSYCICMINKHIYQTYDKYAPNCAPIYQSIAFVVCQAISERLVVNIIDNMT